MKKENFKFEIGHWIKVINGPWKDKTTTITDRWIGINDKKDWYSGYFCGKLMLFKGEDAILDP